MRGHCRSSTHRGEYECQSALRRGKCARSSELGLWRLTANKISEIFGQRLHRRISGKLATVIDQIEHGHHVYRAYFKHAFLKQYEKFCTFLRNELCSNNLKDFALKKSLDNFGSRYAYRLTTKGVEVALLFLFFHKRLCGPLANSRFQNQPDAQRRDDRPLRAGYHRADAAIQKVVDLLAAA